MDLTLIEVEPHSAPLYAALVLLGCLGFLAARRWPKSLALVLPVATLLAWRLAASFAGLLGADMPPGSARYVAREGVLTGAAALIGLGLPLAGARRSRSRPVV